MSNAIVANAFLSKPIVITTGEPAGIGMDIVLDVLLNQKCTVPVVVIACINSLKQRYGLLKQVMNFKTNPCFVRLPYFDASNSDIFADIANFCDSADCQASPKSTPKDTPIFVIDTPVFDDVVPSVLNPKNAKMVQNQLDIAHTLAISGQALAIVTAPIAKSVMIDGGITLPNNDKFCGHTEYFMAKCHLDKVVMMLANAVMKVALVTTHIPLKDVSKAITYQAVFDTLHIVYDSLVRFGNSSPKILVCGLNPHAGENGHLGYEEQTIINPAIHAWQKKGVNISNALPADTIFTQKHLSDCDIIIAMYHDQGLAPLKSHGFGDTVNVTLGLPYVRTSVDHGTALDLAGTGRASSSSLLHAIDLAAQYAKCVI